jgi:hypothetical protein
MSKFKVGDQVFTIFHGWTLIKEVNTDGVKITEDIIYGPDGRMCPRSRAPILFTREEALLKFPEFPPPKRKVTKTNTIWMNIYKTGIGFTHFSEQAAKNASKDRINDLLVETRAITYTWEEEE